MLKVQLYNDIILHDLCLNYTIISTFNIIFLINLNILLSQGCMASYFTVNIALHFLFNWRIEKSILFNIRFSSNTDGIGVGGNIGSFISRVSFIKQYPRSTITQDRSAVPIVIAARGELLRSESEEKSTKTFRKRLQKIAPLPQSSIEPNQNIILNEAEQYDFVVRSASVLST